MNFKPSTNLLDGAPAPSARSELDPRPEGCFQSTAYPAPSDGAASAGSAAAAPVKASECGPRPSKFRKHNRPIWQFAHCRPPIDSGAGLPFASQLRLNPRDDVMKLDLPLAPFARASVACLASCLSRAEGSFQSTAGSASTKLAASSDNATPMSAEGAQRGTRCSAFNKSGWLIVHSADCRAAASPGAVLPFALQLHLNQRDVAMKLDLHLARIAQASVACLAPSSFPSDGESPIRCDDATGASSEAGHV